MSTLKLEGRTAIMTGGLQGIGRSIAKELTEMGAKVAIGARRGGDTELAAQAAEFVGGKPLIRHLDICDGASVADFTGEVRSSLGPVDILVNAAGKTILQPVTGHTDEDWDEMLNINLSGVFRMIRACMPDMIEAKRGRIVNVGSTAAKVAAATHPAYCAAKAGVLGLTKAVAIEGAPHGITCVSVSPAWVETDMLRYAASKLAEASGRTQEDEIAIMGQSNPQGRLIQPEEIAALVGFCCTDAAKGLTMEDLQVNAGALW